MHLRAGSWVPHTVTGGARQPAYSFEPATLLVVVLEFGRRTPSEKQPAPAQSADCHR